MIGYMTKPILRIVIASTRPGRAGIHVGNWFAATARTADLFQVEVSDLKELDFPNFAEPNLPFTGKYELPTTIAWAEQVGGSDAFVLVLPEYNSSFPASLKNALDMVGPEWRGKPVGLVSYGGISGGTRATNSLLPVLLNLGLRPVMPHVIVPFVGQHIEAGQFRPTDPMNRAATGLLDALAAESLS
jgi:NAD(P)H-dependent FMN reductase